MTSHVVRRSTIAITTALVLSSVVIAQSPHELFQQALSKERAEGDLPEAIKLYQRVVDAASADHALAAKALLQLGRCYEQLGNTEARGAYERLIARYPDQSDMVAQAKVRLSALAPVAASRAAMSVRPLPDLGKDGEVQAVSTDGTRAIVMDYSKGQNIALYDLARKQKRLLTDFDWGASWVYYALWSPDARRAAYQQANLSGDEWELRVTALDGQSSVVFRSGGPVKPVGWTPDGATLVALVVRPDRTVAVGTVPVRGGQFTAVRSFGWSDVSARLSPDGRFIAYHDGESETRDVHVVSIDGRDAYRITDDPANDRAPVWSPDSRYLAFTSTRQGSLALWAVEIKDGKPVGQPSKLKDGMQSANVLDWTERGIFYEQRTDSWDLYTLSMDPGGLRPTGSPQQLPYWRTGRNVSPVWSPDGGRLAFVSSSATEQNRRYVVVMPADGGPAREFAVPTTRWEYSQSPYDLRWFGDGRGLGFSGHDTRYGPTVFRLTLDTGQWDIIPLPEGQYRTAIEWNRDGSAFYFARTVGATTGIFERTIKDDVERPVYRSAAPLMNLTRLEFSPDRKWLGFQQWTLNATDKTITKRIPVVDVTTGETRIVGEAISANDGSGLDLVGWAPSGDVLIHRRKAGGAASESVRVPINGGPARPVTIPTFAPSGPGGALPALVAKWSSDGRTIVLGRVSRGSETFVIENPLASVRAATASRR